jgi:hypothetical protein
MDEVNFESLVHNLSDKLQSNQSGLLSTSNSADLLSISPIFGKQSTFDSQSLDESIVSATPEDDLIKGIRNINYDISYDLDSPENSLAEEIAQIRKYSSLVNQVTSIEPSSLTMSKSDLEEFDPLLIKEKAFVPQSDDAMNKSLIDDDSPNALNLLDQPIQPLKNPLSEYKGISSQIASSKIQTISCETGQHQSAKNQK